MREIVAFSGKILPLLVKIDEGSFGKSSMLSVFRAEKSCT